MSTTVVNDLGGFREDTGSDTFGGVSSRPQYQGYQGVSNMATAQYRVIKALPANPANIGEMFHSKEDADAIREGRAIVEDSGSILTKNW